MLERIETPKQIRLIHAGNHASTRDLRMQTWIGGQRRFPVNLQSKSVPSSFQFVVCTCSRVSVSACIALQPDFFRLSATLTVQPKTVLTSHI